MSSYCLKCKKQQQQKKNNNNRKHELNGFKN